MQKPNGSAQIQLCVECCNFRLMPILIWLYFCINLDMKIHYNFN